MLQLPDRQVEADADRALGAEPPRTLPGARPDFQDALSLQWAQRADLGLGEALGPPDETDVTQELAVGCLVLVGVPVPFRAVGPTGLLLVDLAAVHRHG